MLGIDQNNHIYAFEVAFHENGLQYGGKIETRNRIFKKLLRGYITLKCYFPNYQHSIAFCSPKVNPTTDLHIKDYFEVLTQDFQAENSKFYYFSNEKFYYDIAQNTLTKTISESDSSELFARSIKLFNITNKFSSSILQPIQPNQNSESTSAETSQTCPATLSNETININDISIPFTKREEESVQDFVKKIMRLLLNNNLLSQQEIKNLQDKEYSKRTFYLQFPLLRKVSEGYKDTSGRGRYWSKEIFGSNFYVCSQWWKDHHETYLVKLRNWLKSIGNK